VTYRRSGCDTTRLLGRPLEEATVVGNDSMSPPSGGILRPGMTMAKESEVPNA
jgi:hypothetical protein